jgi:hypothetical protein
MSEQNNIKLNEILVSDERNPCTKEKVMGIINAMIGAIETCKFFPKKNPNLLFIAKTIPNTMKANDEEQRKTNCIVMSCFRPLVFAIKLNEYEVRTDPKISEALKK